MNFKLRPVPGIRGGGPGLREHVPGRRRLRGPVVEPQSNGLGREESSAGFGTPGLRPASSAEIFPCQDLSGAEFPGRQPLKRRLRPGGEPNDHYLSRETGRTARQPWKNM